MRTVRLVKNKSNGPYFFLATGSKWMPRLVCLLSPHAWLKFQSIPRLLFLLSPKGFFKSKRNNLLKNHSPLLKNHSRQFRDYCDTIAEVVIQPERCLRRGKMIKAERCVHWGWLKQRTKESPGWWNFGCRSATSLSFCMCLFGLGWRWYRCWP